MTDYTLGRTVAERLRHARMIALGDRKAPLCITPALIGTRNDESELNISTNLMPFVVDYDSSSLPASMTITGRGPMAMPFDNDSPQWECKMNHVLPPSLEENNALTSILSFLIM